MKPLHALFTLLLLIGHLELFSQKRKVEVDKFTGDKTITYTFGITNLLFEIKSIKKGSEESNTIVLMQPATSQDFFTHQNGFLKKLEILLNSGESISLSESEVKGVFGITNTAMGYIAVASVEITPRLLVLMRQCKSFRLEGIGKGNNLGDWNKKVNGIIDLFVEDHPDYQNEKKM